MNGVLLTGTVVALSCLQAYSAEYELRILGTLRADGQGASNATAINDSGVIVGYADKDNGQIGPFRTLPDGSLQDLGFLYSPSFYALAFDINNAGEITGYAATQSGGFAAAFRATGPGLTELPRLSGGGDAVAYAINAQGTIVGYGNRAIGCGAPECQPNRGFAVKWVGSQIQDLPDLGGIFSVATGINDAGDICGNAAPIGINQSHAYRIPASTGLPVDLGTLGGARSVSAAINSSGHVVGSAMNADGLYRGALWIGDTAEDLGLLPGSTESFAQDLNDRGVIVGSAAQAAGANPRAIVFRRGGPAIDLNALIAATPDFTLTSADGINASGQIVGTGVTSGGISRAFLLTPHPALHIGLTDSTHAQLRWLATFQDYILETSDDISAINWPRVLAEPTLSGNDLVVPIELTDTQRFYRLRPQP